MNKDRSTLENHFGKETGEETGALVPVLENEEINIGEIDVFGTLARNAKLTMAREDRQRNTHLAEYEAHLFDFEKIENKAKEDFEQAKTAYEERKASFKRERLAWFELKKQADLEDASIIAENSALLEDYFRSMGHSFKSEVFYKEEKLNYLRYRFPIFTDELVASFVTYFLKDVYFFVNYFKMNGSFRSFEELIYKVFYNDFYTSFKVEFSDSKGFFESLDSHLRKQNLIIIQIFSFLLSDICKIIYEESSVEFKCEDELLTAMGLSWKDLSESKKKGLSLSASVFELISKRIKEFKTNSPEMKKKLEDSVGSLGLKYLLAHAERPLENFKDIRCKDEDVCFGLVCEIVRLFITDKDIGIEFPVRPVLKERTAAKLLPEEPVFTENEPVISDFLTVEKPIIKPFPSLIDARKFPDFSKLDKLSSLMKVHILRHHLNEQFNVVLELVEDAFSRADVKDLKTVKSEIDSLSVLFRQLRIKGIIDNFADRLRVEEDQNLELVLSGLIEMIKLSAFIIKKGRILFANGVTKKQKAEGRLHLFIALQLKEKTEEIAVGIESMLMSKKYQSGAISSENIALLSRFFDGNYFSDLTEILTRFDESISTGRELDGVGGVRDLMMFDERLNGSTQKALPAKDLEEF